MSELDNLILVTAAAMAIIHLIGPSVVWRITRGLWELLLIILLLIWVL